jgi:hypothetical protein
MITLTHESPFQLKSGHPLLPVIFGPFFRYVFSMSCGYFQKNFALRFPIHAKTPKRQSAQKTQMNSPEAMPPLPIVVVVIRSQFASNAFDSRPLLSPWKH